VDVHSSCFKWAEPSREDVLAIEKVKKRPYLDSRMLSKGIVVFYTESPSVLKDVPLQRLAGVSIQQT
jgi:hypothetical protein